jgi:hypothetical protein
LQTPPHPSFSPQLLPLQSAAQQVQMPWLSMQLPTWQLRQTPPQPSG